MNKEMTVSFMLACAVVIGVLWLIVESDQGAKKQPIPAPSARTSAPQPQVADMPEPTSNSVSSQSAFRQEGRSAGNGIVKCTVKGKTIYSDQACPDGARTHQVELHDTAGIISPKQETLPRLTAQRVAAEQFHASPSQPAAAAPPASNQTECESLNMLIERLDSMARQPQSGQRQDQIRQERKNARDRQFAIQC